MGGLSADHLPLAGPGSAGLSRTGTHENTLGCGSGIRLGGHHPHEVTGAPGEGGKREGRVSPSSTYQAPEAPEEDRAGIYLSFHGHVCWAWANLVISFIQGGFSPIGKTALCESIQTITTVAANTGFGGQGHWVGMMRSTWRN